MNSPNKVKNRWKKNAFHVLSPILEKPWRRPYNKRKSETITIALEPNEQCLDFNYFPREVVENSTKLPLTSFLTKVD